MTAASPWVERYIGGVPAGGAVLDIACGAGRHIALARRLSYQVTGVDRDVTAARARFGGDRCVTLVEQDLETGAPPPFRPRAFDGVIVTNYLWRAILPDIAAAVAPGGLLLYETFRAGNERFGKPSRPEFLLRPGELLAAFAGTLHVVACEEVTLTSPQRCVARICAVAPGHPWIDNPIELGASRPTQGQTS